MKHYVLGALLLGAVVMPVSAFAYATSSSTSVNLACMQTAVEKREGAIMDAWDGLHDDMTEALSERRDALKAAWGMSNRTERKAAIRNAWKEFKSARNAARKAFNSAKKNAWKTFKADAKACKGADEESGTESSDAL